MNTSILTQTLLSFLTVLSGGYHRIIPDALVVMRYLVAIEIIVFGIMIALGAGNFTTEALKKITMIGFFIWIVNRSAWLSKVLLDSFVQAGILAGGGGIPVSIMKDPSKMIDKGIALSKIIYTDMISGWHPIDAVLFALCILLIMLAFCAIAWSIFLVLIEFYLFTIASVILIPFGVNKHTAWLAERAIGGAFAVGFKMMILSLIVALSYNTIMSISLPVDPDFEKVMVVVCISGTIALLCWHAPNLLAGYIAGGGQSLSASHVLAPALAAVGMVGISRSGGGNSDANGSATGKDQMKNAVNSGGSGGSGGGSGSSGTGQTKAAVTA